MSPTIGMNAPFLWNYLAVSHIIGRDTGIRSPGVTTIRDTIDKPRRSGLVRSLADGTWRVVRRLLITVVGVVVLIIGIVMIVTPGPAILVIPAGLAILGTEFGWARRQVERIKAQTRRRSK